MRLVKVGLASVNTTVGAFSRNLDRALALARKMAADDVTVGLFQEQLIGGYPAEDLIQWQGFIDHQWPELERFARELLWQTGHGALPVLGAAHREPSSLPTLDARMEAFLTNHVANRASRTQGRAFLGTCARIFPGPVGQYTLVKISSPWRRSPFSARPSTSSALVAA